MREIRSREQGFSSDYVVNLLATYPSLESIFNQISKSTDVEDSRMANVSRHKDGSSHRKGANGSVPNSRRGSLQNSRHGTTKRGKGDNDDDRKSICDDSEHNDIDGDLAEESIHGWWDADANDPAISGRPPSKTQAEGFYCLVMPRADRNMFVALKQERFAGKVMYMHSDG
jgi:hypothetical protein